MSFLLHPREETGGAVISDCGTCRYLLYREWGDGSRLVWVMLNPSTADANADDPTIRRVRSFTKREGYDGFEVVNVWAYRATDPKDLHANRRPLEPENIKQVEATVKGRDVVVAWGSRVVHGPGLQQIRMALKGAGTLRCLGFTKGGEPRHPLMLRTDTPLVPWGTG